MKKFSWIILFTLLFSAVSAQESVLYNSDNELYVDHLYPIDEDVLEKWVEIEAEVMGIFKTEIQYPDMLKKVGIKGMCIVGLEMKDGKLKPPNLAQCIGGGSDEEVTAAVIHRHDDLEELLRKTGIPKFTVYIPIYFNLTNDPVKHAVNILP